MVPHVLIRELSLRYARKTVSRLLVAHPASVQYIDHYPEEGRVCIRYTTGQEVCVDDTNKEYMKEMFDSLVDQIKQEK